MKEVVVREKEVMFQCEICGTQYYSEKECRDCEAEHLPEIVVKNKTFLARERYPRVIDVYDDLNNLTVKYTLASNI